MTKFRKPTLDLIDKGYITFKIDRDEVDGKFYQRPNLRDTRPMPGILFFLTRNEWLHNHPVHP